MYYLKEAVCYTFVEIVSYRRHISKIVNSSFSFPSFFRFFSPTFVSVIDLLFKGMIIESLFASLIYLSIYLAEKTIY